MSTEIHQNFGRRKSRNLQKKSYNPTSERKPIKNSDQYRKDWLFQKQVLSKMSLRIRKSN